MPTINGKIVKTAIDKLGNGKRKKLYCNCNSAWCDSEKPKSRHKNCGTGQNLVCDYCLMFLWFHYPKGKKEVPK